MHSSRRTTREIVAVLPVAVALLGSCTSEGRDEITEPADVVETAVESSAPTTIPATTTLSGVVDDTALVECQLGASVGHADVMVVTDSIGNLDAVKVGGAAFLQLDFADEQVIHTGRETDYPPPTATDLRSGIWATADMFDQWGDTTLPTPLDGSHFVVFAQALPTSAGITQVHAVATAIEDPAGSISLLGRCAPRWQGAINRAAAALGRTPDRQFFAEVAQSGSDTAGMVEAAYSGVLESP